VGLASYLRIDLLLTLVKGGYGSLDIFDLGRFRTINSGDKISWTHFLEPPQSFSLGSLLFFLLRPLSLFNVCRLTLKLLRIDFFESL
jgi:hypothetical protein